MLDGKRILICISGGGAIQLESAAGVLAALDDAGAFSGASLEYRACSGGAPVAALHASGMTGAAIAQMIRKTPMEKLIHLPFFGRYFDASGVMGLLKPHMPTEPLRNCRVAVTRLRDMKSCMVDATPVTVVTSLSIPGVFRPQMIDNELYVDGGVKNLIPTCPIPELAGYDSLYLLLSPEAKESHAENSTGFLFNTELKSLSSLMDREITQIYEDGWDRIKNVTVIRPTIPKEAGGRSLVAELLEWSPNNCMIDHAYRFTTQLLKEKERKA